MPAMIGILRQCKIISDDGYNWYQVAIGYNLPLTYLF